NATATQATPIPKNMITSATNLTQQIHVVLGLAPRNKARLDALVVAVSTPGNLQFGQTITPPQFLAGYAPSATDVSLVENYLKGLGFTNIETSANHLTVSAYGTAEAVENAFNTSLVSFNYQGRSVFANTSPAQVPASLGGIVVAVLGLQDFSIMTVPIMPSTPQNPITTPPYSGPEYQVAYDAGKTPTGQNTTIGIVTEGDLTQVPKDLRQYEEESHLPQVAYQIVPTGLQTSDTAGLD